MDEDILFAFLISIFFVSIGVALGILVGFLISYETETVPMGDLICEQEGYGEFVEFDKKYNTIVCQGTNNVRVEGRVTYQSHDDCGDRNNDGRVVQYESQH